MFFVRIEEAIEQSAIRPEQLLRPGGKLLLLTTEDTFTGAWCSRLWHCRTYNRVALRAVAEECGLTWQRELWFSPVHRWMKLGGIIVELHRTSGGAAQ